MSKILSGRIVKGLGCGGLKLGGAEIGVRGVSEVFADDLTKNTLSFVGALRVNTGLEIGMWVTFSIPAMASRREEKWAELRVGGGAG